MPCTKYNYMQIMKLVRLIQYIKKCFILWCNFIWMYIIYILFEWIKWQNIQYILYIEYSVTLFIQIVLEPNIWKSPYDQPILNIPVCNEQINCLCKIFLTSSNLRSYFENMERICDEKFNPNTTDVLRARIRTQGIIETCFKLNGLVFR